MSSETAAPDGVLRPHGARRSLTTPSQGLLLFLAILTAGLTESGTAAAQSINFQTLRYDDDLSSLRREPTRAAPSYNYLPLGDQAFLSLGGEARMRFEYAEAPALGRNLVNGDLYGLHRLLIHADLHASDDVRAFVQLGAFAAPGKKNAAPPAMGGPDLQQVFVDVSGDLGGGRLTGRFGRQELALGAQRLVSLRDGPNTRLAFDGARVLYRRGAVRADFLALRPVTEESGAFDNRTADDRALAGVYLTFPAPVTPGSFDTYVLHYRRDDAVFGRTTGDERRWSVGARTYGRQDALDWDAEAMIQRGDFGSRSIAAWAVSIDAGLTRQHGPWRRRLGLKLDAISGDRDPSDGDAEATNPMFPKLPYLGSAAAFAPTNLLAVHPELTFSRGPGSVTLGYQAAWRQTTKDAVYVAPLAPLPGTAEHGGRFTAHQWSVDASWRFSAAWRLDAAIAWVDTDRELEAVGAKDTGVAFAAITWRF